MEIFKRRENDRENKGLLLTPLFSLASAFEDAPFYEKARGCGKSQYQPLLPQARKKNRRRSGIGLL